MTLGCRVLAKVCDSDRGKFIRKTLNFSINM